MGLLLSDSSPSVIGAAASAFLVICPENLSLLAPRFRKLCEMLPDVDEWGQVVLLDILMRYAVARYFLISVPVLCVLYYTLRDLLVFI